MDFVVGMGFVLCMLYLFYERENRQKSRPQLARARASSGRSSSARASAARGKRTTKRTNR